MRPLPLRNGRARGSSPDGRRCGTGRGPVRLGLLCRQRPGAWLLTLPFPVAAIDPHRIQPRVPRRRIVRPLAPGSVVWG